MKSTTLTTLTHPSTSSTSRPLLPAYWCANLRRTVAILDSNGSEAPTNTLPLRRIDGGGCGSGFVDASDEISIAPSMSSLGSFDEQSGSAPLLVLQQAQEADKTDGPLPPVLHLPPALDHTMGKNRQSFRRRSGPSISLTLPRGGAVSAGSEKGSAAAIEGVVCAERERSSSRLGIAFGGPGKRRRSRRLSSSSSSAVGVRLAYSPVAAAVDPDGEQKSVPSAAGLPLTGAARAAGAAASSTTTAVATAALLKRKINWWRSLSKPPPKVPHRPSALTTPTSEDGLSRGTTTSSAPLYSRRQSECGDGDAVRDGSTVSMAPSVSSTISREPQPQLSAAMGGVTGDEKTLAGSVTSSLTSLGASVRGPMPVRPLAEADSSATSFASTSGAPGSGALAVGHSVAGSAATASWATTKGLTAGRSGADDGGAGGETRGRLNSGEHSKPRKKRRGLFGGDQRVHKINLGSKKHQKVR